MRTPVPLLVAFLAVLAAGCSASHPDSSETLQLQQGIYTSANLYFSAHPSATRIIVCADRHCSRVRGTQAGVQPGNYNHTVTLSVTIKTRDGRTLLHTIEHVPYRLRASDGRGSSKVRSAQVGVNKGGTLRILSS